MVKSIKLINITNNYEKSIPSTNIKITLTNIKITFQSSAITFRSMSRCETRS